VGKYIGLLEVNQKGHLKVTREIVDEVFRLYAEGMPQASIARHLRISAATTNQIIKGTYRFSKRIDEPTVEKALQAMADNAIADERKHVLNQLPVGREAENQYE
jgi:DNA invertase Pin-like site-specific DNA recombinase